MKVQIFVEVITGKVYKSNVQDVTKEELESTQEVFESLKDLSKLYIKVGKSTVYFNTEHVITANIVKIEE